MGYQALIQPVRVSLNIAIGRQALYSNISGSSNVALGATALIFLWTGPAMSQSVPCWAQYCISRERPCEHPIQYFLGDSTNLWQVNAVEIVIGYAAEGSELSGNIGNTSVVATVLQGNVGVGTYNSKSK